MVVVLEEASVVGAEAALAATAFFATREQPVAPAPDLVFVAVNPEDEPLPPGHQEAAQLQFAAAPVVAAPKPAARHPVEAARSVVVFFNKQTHNHNHNVLKLKGQGQTFSPVRMLPESSNYATTDVGHARRRSVRCLVPRLLANPSQQESK
jgi:hypothetical protein